MKIYLNNYNFIFTEKKRFLNELLVPLNITFSWNFGFLLFITLMIQIITGLFLVSYYSPNEESSFMICNLIIEYTNLNWLVRTIHFNGASIFFFFIYIHVRRGLYYHSYKLIHTWMIGVTILIITIATAFIGYVLPFTQISFWGASVITNLFSEVPYIGKDLVKLIWGSSYVRNPTIMRFFILHFLLPFLILVISFLHLTYLHTTGSKNPIGFKKRKSFFLKAIYIDFLILFIIILFIIFFLIYPLIFRDHDNFFNADPLVTPHHIQPEWYFLFSYAILRSIPNKLGGVIALLFSVAILYTLPFINNFKINLLSSFFLLKIFFWIFIFNIIILTWIGSCPVEHPYIIIGQISTVLYFMYFFSVSIISIL